MKAQFAESDPGIGTVRRLYFYTVSLAGLSMTAGGVVEILHFVLDSLVRAPFVGDNGIRLVAGLSLTIVGLPLWAFHWRLVTRQVREMPVEARSLVRKAYLYIVLAIAAGVFVASAITFAQWVFANRSFSGFSASALLIWGPVWLYHWRLESAEGQATPMTRAVRRLYLYVASAGMLGVAAVGASLVLNQLFGQAYDAMARTSLISGTLWATPMKIGLSLTLIGGAAWAAHWLYLAREDYASTLRRLYQQGYAVLGGSVAALVGGGIMIYHALAWTIGVPAETSIADHFDALPPALTTLIVGATVLTYHAYNQAGPAAGAQEANESRRAGEYVLAAMGLVALVLAVFVLVSMSIVVFITSGDEVMLGQRLWRNELALAVTIALLGAPLWGYYWSRAQARAEADACERVTTARRTFIFAVLGIGLLATASSLSAVIFIFLRELLDGTLGDVPSDATAALAVLGAMALFLPYYWTVYQSDRRYAVSVLREQKPEPRAVTVLTPDGAAEFLQGLESALGYGVTALHWTDAGAALPEMTQETVSDLARRIGEAPGPGVLLVPDGGTLRVLSCR